MIRIPYIAAVALFSAALLIISAPQGLAAAPGEESGPPMGQSQVTGQGAPAPGYTPGQTPTTSQGSMPGSQYTGAGMQGQGGAPGSQYSGAGMTGQGGAPGPSGQQQYSGGPPMAGGQGGYAGPAGQGTGSPTVEAIVVGIDQPDGCLRVRRGPSSNYEQIGCARMGEKLNLTRVFSSDNRWAQLDNNGWVFACQIKTDFVPPGPQVSCGAPSGGRAWREPATFGGDFGPTIIYERDYYTPSWGGHWGHRWKHQGGHHGGGHHGGGHHGGGHHGGGHHKK